MRAFLLDRLVLREILPPLAVGMLGILQLLLLAQILQLNEVVFGGAVTLEDLGRVTLGLLPHFLVTAVPLAYVLGLQVGLGRLHESRELLALATVGRGPLSLYRVPFLLALLLGAGAVWLARVGEPWGLSELNRVLDAVIKRNLETGLLPGVFNDGLPRFMIYVEKREGPEKGESSALPQWRHVLIEDRTSEGPPLLALAEEGRIVDDGGDVLTLELRRGELHRPEEHGEVVARFDKAALGVGVRVPLKMKNRLANSEAAIPGERLEEVALQRQAEGQPHLAARARLEKVRRVAVPLSCLAFLLLAVPLSLVSGGARGAAYLSTLLAFALFYVLGRAGLVLAERGGPLWLAGFLPDLVVAGGGLVLSARLLWRGIGSAR